MNREEVKQELVRIMLDTIPKEQRPANILDTQTAAENILQFLEDIGFNYEMSYMERMGLLDEYLKGLNE